MIKEQTNNGHYLAMKQMARLTTKLRTTALITDGTVMETSKSD